MFSPKQQILRPIVSEEFDQFFSILKTSFPEDEYRTYIQQKALLNHPLYHIFVVPDDGKQLKAFITVWEFSNFVYIEHFAVNPMFRNQHLGSQILQELLFKYSCRLCLEVELPETDFAQRRIHFYQRNGFSLNHYPHVQPAYSKEKNSVPLLIMTSAGEITETEFLEIKKSLYREVYQADMTLVDDTSIKN